MKNKTLVIILSLVVVFVMAFAGIVFLSMNRDARNEPETSASQTFVLPERDIGLRGYCSFFDDIPEEQKQWIADTVEEYLLKHRKNSGRPSSVIVFTYEGALYAEINYGREEPSYLQVTLDTEHCSVKKAALTMIQVIDAKEAYIPADA